MGHRHYGFYWQGANAEYNVYKTSALHIIPDNVSLAWIECQPSGGKTPRNFALDRTGRYLLAENQDSDNITVFAIGEDGRLTKQESYAFGSPVCIRFFKKTAF